MRWQGKYFFLTYSQAGELNSDDLAAHLHTLPKAINFLRLAIEHHKDGNIHYHCAIQFEKRISTENARYFDHQGCHPNVQTARSFPKVCSYIAKESTFEDFGEIREVAGGSGDAQNEFELNAEITRCADYGEWLQICISNKIGYGFCDSSWKYFKKNSKYTVYNNNYEGGMCNELILREFDPRIYCTALVGDPGTGKTNWCKKHAPLPYLWIRHADHLKDFDPETHKSIIFDEMKFTHQPLQGQINLVDWENDSSIHVRYVVADIPAKVHRFFTCNEPIFADHEAIRRRCCFIELTNCR